MGWTSEVDVNSESLFPCFVCCSKQIAHRSYKAANNDVGLLKGQDFLEDNFVFYYYKGRSLSRKLQYEIARACTDIKRIE